MCSMHGFAEWRNAVNNPLYKIGYFNHNKTACLFQTCRGADECEKQMVAGVAVNLGVRF